MNIYFAGSIRGGRKDAGIYALIVEWLRNYGNVLTEHVASPGLIPGGEENLSDAGIHNRDMNWLQRADTLIAEVTLPSLGVGYEIGRAVELKKPVLCLFRPNEDQDLSAMIAGCPAISIIRYNKFQDATPEIERFFRQL